MKRADGRTANQLRPVTLKAGANPYAEGSCMVKFGNTHVLCTASVDGKVPMWLRGQKQGWITAEYGMLPRATHDRVDREATKGKQSGRSLEIQRLIGRAMRSVCDLSGLGERTIWLDCDVIQADGGTRTAAITGAYVALHHAIQHMLMKGKIKKNPLREYIAAISCGVIQNAEGLEAVLDLDYSEDSGAVADANFVLTESGNIVEIQTCAEKHPLETSLFNGMAKLAHIGVDELISLQKKATGQEK